MKAFVSFVSSGPGDPELLTVKAVKRIKNADVILYDDLSAGAILDLASQDADLVAVGKRSGKSSTRQDNINQLLIDFAISGANIVRLKSGDAGIFGRLEEEINAIQSENVEYEIIPGVSSPTAAMAALGLPLTRRSKARRVQLITAHDIEGKLPKDLNIPALVDPNSVLVIFMGKKTFPKLATILINNGLDLNTPAILAENVSREDEKFIHSDLGSLPKILSEEQMTSSPGIIILGSIMEKN